MLAWYGICYGPVSACLSDHLSVTSQSSTETASEIPPGSPPAGAPNAVGVG